MKTWKLGYEKSKRKAKLIYSRIGRIPSPALNGEYVAFNNEGFNHLVRKGRIPRTRNEQKRRFILLPYAEQIIKNPKATILYRSNEIKYYSNRHGEKILLTSTAYFWTFVQTVNNCQIKVVVRQLDKGQKHFFSIMGDKIIIDKTLKRRKTKKSL